MRLLLVVLIGVFSSLVGSVPAFAQAKIKVSYSLVYDRIRPEPQSNVAVTSRSDIELARSGAVKEETTRSAGRFSDNFKVGTKLGGEWEVMGADQLRRTFDQAQSQLVLTVTVTDKTCKLDAKFSLKPGFQEYKFKRITDGSWAFFTEPKIQSTTCTIQ